MICDFNGDEPIYGQIAEYIEYCRDVKCLSAQTLTNKSVTYHQFIEQSGCTDLKYLTNHQFNQFIKAQLARGVSPRTINTRVTNLKVMLKYHTEMGLDIPIKLPLIQSLREIDPHRVFYTREQIEEVLDTLNLEEENECLRRDSVLDWLLIRVSFDTGLRISELQNLRLRDFSGRRIYVIGKGSKADEVYVAEDTYEVLRYWITLAGVKDFLWISERGTHLSVDELRIRMRKVFKVAGYSDFHPHALRHSFCTDIQRRGAELIEMQTMLRHSNPQTTEIYSHGFDGRKQALFDKYRGSSKPTRFYRLRVKLAELIAPNNQALDFGGKYGTIRITNQK